MSLISSASTTIPNWNNALNSAINGTTLTQTHTIFNGILGQPYYDTSPHPEKIYCSVTGKMLVSNRSWGKTRIKLDMFRNFGTRLVMAKIEKTFSEKYLDSFKQKP